MTFDYLSGPSGLIDGIIRVRAALMGAKPFVEFGAGSLTYAEFDRQVEALARGLLAQGLERGQAVGVCTARRPEFITSMFAIQRAGGVFVPLAPYAAADELADQLEMADVRQVITDSLDGAIGEAIATSRTARPISVERSDGDVCLDDLIDSDEASVTLPVLTADDPATIIFTSGTTARPKGVLLTHGNLASAGRRLQEAYEWVASDRVLHFFPLFHANGGLACLLPAVTSGATLVLIEKFSATQFSEQLVKHQITYCHVNSTHCNILLNTPTTDFDAAHGVRRMMLGLTLEPAAWRAFEQRFATTLCPSYGMTECATLVVGGGPSDGVPPGSAGRVYRGFELRVVDSTGAALEHGADGEIQVRSLQRHGLSPGYINDPQATKDLFVDDWIRTGDMGQFDSSGALWITGRVKDMIKHSGFNVAPTEVERVIGELNGVDDVAVVGVPDPIREEQIVAFVVISDGSAVDSEALLEQCHAKLAHYKVPQRLFAVDAIPRNLVGKVDRKELRVMAAKDDLAEVPSRDVTGHP